jgi:hypothetical protein
LRRREFASLFHLVMHQIMHQKPCKSRSAKSAKLG